MNAKTVTTVTAVSMAVLLYAGTSFATTSPQSVPITKAAPAAIAAQIVQAVQHGNVKPVHLIPYVAPPSNLPANFPKPVPPGNEESTNSANSASPQFAEVYSFTFSQGPSNGVEATGFFNTSQPNISVNASAESSASTSGTYVITPIEETASGGVSYGSAYFPYGANGSYSYGTQFWNAPAGTYYLTTYSPNANISGYGYVYDGLSST